MSNIAAKTISNAFYKARCAASTHNEQLKSREGAADMMSIDRGRIYRIESGIVAPYPGGIWTASRFRHCPHSIGLGKSGRCCWISPRTA